MFLNHHTKANHVYRFRILQQVVLLLSLVVFLPLFVCRCKAFTSTTGTFSSTTTSQKSIITSGAYDRTIIPAFISDHHLTTALQSSISTTTTTTTTATTTEKYVSRRNLQLMMLSNANDDVPVIQSGENNNNDKKKKKNNVIISSDGDDDGDNYDNDDVPVPVEWRSEVLEALRAVIDPDLNADIVTLGFVQNLKLVVEEVDEESTGNNDKVEVVKVSFDVELTTPARPVKEKFQSECESIVLEKLSYVDIVDVTMTAQKLEQSSQQQQSESGMSQVGAVIAVSSCKGGVGKSTTSVNLAYALQKLGATVGIFDADVYGPSLPTMVQPDDDIVRFVGRQIAPLQRNGVQLMSFGYINDGSAVMRGPMVSQLLDQFLSVTAWGSLDYLILDMPPGTGDIQLTLTQRLNITAAVIVTTPQELSFADVVRGVEMFDTVNVPCIAVVENMAYYDIDLDPAHQSGGQQVVNNVNELERNVRDMLIQKGIPESVMKTEAEETTTNNLKNNNLDLMAEELVQLVLQNAKTDPVQIFGPGHKQRLSEQYGIEHTFSMPLHNDIAYNGDSGTPYLLEHPNSSQAKIYEKLSKSVVSEISKLKHSSNGRNQRPDINYIEEFHIMSVNDEPLKPAELRRACRCAACVEELTGKQLLKPNDVPESIKPIQMSSTGNYALSVTWSDGHRSLYPYRQIISLIEDEEEEEEESSTETSSIDDGIEKEELLSSLSEQKQQKITTSNDINNSVLDSSSSDNRQQQQQSSLNNNREEISSSSSVVVVKEEKKECCSECT